MKDALRAALATLRARARLVLGFARQHRFWVECGAVATVALLAAIAVGVAALMRTSELERQIAALEQIEAGLDRWETELQRPAPQESLSWRQSEQTLQRLAATTSEPLSIARLVAQRGEEVGIRGMTIRVVEAADAAPLAQAQGGPWSVRSGGTGLQVEFDGDMSDVVGFLGTLPPQAVVSTLQLAPQGEVLQATVVLLTRLVEPRV